MTGPAFSVVVPCYDEAPNIAPLLAAFAAAASCPFELILVDNGSSDGTGAAIDALLPLYPFARKAVLPVNRGYGAGVLAGLRLASAPVVGWTHADLQFPPSAVFEAARLAAGAGGPAFVKGLRTGRPAFDRFFTWGMGLVCSLVLGGRMRDVSGQPVMFGRRLLDALAGGPGDFSLDMYAYAAAMRRGFRVLRFPVPVSPRRSGVSAWNRGLSSRLGLSLRMAAACFRARRALGRAG